MSQLIWAFDAINHCFVPNYHGSNAVLGPLRQSTYNVKIYLVQPTTDSVPGGANYEKFESAGYDGIRLGLWENATGTLAGEDPFILALSDQTRWTYNTDDGDYPYFTGTFSVNTEEVAAWIGSACSARAYLALNLVLGTELYEVFDQKGSPNIVVYAASDGGSGQAVSLTGPVPRFTLPCEFVDPETNEIYTLRRTAQGEIGFAWTNPP